MTTDKIVTLVGKTTPKTTNTGEGTHGRTTEPTRNIAKGKIDASPNVCLMI